ncbi:MAG: site-specific integrase [Eubacteriales bacterium]|nr:site-specific integrase [Eubacteriales bacterium]
MGEKQKTLDVLTFEVISYLQKLSYSSSRISQYRSAWQRVAAFMKENDLQFYTASVGEAFIYHLIGNRRYDDLERWEKGIIQCANVLTEFLETGAVKFRRCQKFRELQGAVGQTMQNYIAYRKSYGISRETVEEYKHRFQNFLSYLEDNDIRDVRLISQQLLMNYANQLGFCTPYVRHRNLSVIKGYLRYLYDQGLIETDCSRMVPKDKFVKQPKLPSTYTKEEVEALITCIDRSSPKGKRDYAMVLITARLGLRATDVCCLTFENIRWEQSLIVLNQQKTGERIDLPLLSEIGEAIIDYLKYGRPESKLPYIFLHVTSPYDRLNRSTLHSIICLYLRKAGIKFKEERKHGPHALRHSLAGILLEKKTPLPIISEVLGHKNTESTRYYLRIDMNSLRQCALEVPPVNTSFYGRSVIK